ncbi:sister chromatid cohesion 1 protein 4-like isoform X2 [Mangifera indica]|uniref:sister chromatid cohesion 1 protein 4-like isoform X2 n=1 Tax=Mangifera indica TaxID=29780 RepID=UPI001CF96D16|nr:sister chromatid cohesion 1 protein 4-like isoform X2 [Mangifera indica]
MFYSQFILAKKGPLGTIWIAAHLERKLRKNQVADTDIGVSVDSILFPEVPIALRLSSHLLLGVVRIYSRKVNYLFDDCSEALLKIKQAFRSTAVDLPPEESTAPYHSITLPETFDLDDFELPENDIFQGNYVDHHVSTREQITLQDTMDGVVYSTSQFGLDERFGDGDASQIGLDLDEELLRVTASGHDAVSNADPQGSVKSLTPWEEDNIGERINETSEATAMNDNLERLGVHAESLEYAEAPSTPGLVQEPNLSCVQEAQASDDHLESEDHNSNELVATVNGNHIGGLEVKHAEPLRDSVNLMPMVLEYSERTIGALDGSDRMENMQNASVGGNVPNMISVQQGVRSDETAASPCCFHVTSQELSHRTCPDSTNDVSEGDLMDGQGSIRTKIQSDAEISENVPMSAAPAIVDAEGHASREPKDTTAANKPGDLEEMSSNVLKPCSSHLSQPDMSSPGYGHYVEIHSSETSRRAPVEVQGEECHVTDILQSEKDQISGPSICGEIDADNKKSDELLDNVVSNDQLENLNNSTSLELPEPEKLLSVPEGSLDKPNDLLVDSTPEKALVGSDGVDAGIKLVSGKKRSYTESTLTVESLNSSESFGAARYKRTSESIPDDDDLLSSILVGRKSSVLKLKPTPPAPEVPSRKRTRSVPQTSALKRKVLMDDTMVLHGDIIRQQLTNTEDIRRIRKKAPCTCPEILMIQIQFLENEIFSEPIFTGMSAELMSLLCETPDLSRIRVSETDENHGSSEPAKDVECSFRSNVEDGEDGSKYPEVHVEAQLAETFISGHVLGSHDIDARGGTNAITDAPELEAVQNEPLAEVTEMDIDRANVEVAETANFSAEINCPIEIQNMPDEDKTNGAYASLQIDTLGITPEQKLDIKPVGDNATLVDTSNGKVVDAVEGEDTVAIDTELKARDELPLKEGKVGVFVQNEGDGLTDFTANGVMNEDGFQSADLGCDRLDPNSNLVYGEEPLIDPTNSVKHDTELKDTSLNDEENPIFVDADHPAAEDRGELEGITVEHDTEFLNVDDDEVAEDHDDRDGCPEDTRLLENSGWSSRTRAVAKYLQTLFEEPVHGRKLLALDNLLSGKTRKEASRMFFETLVLTTKDYIQVEQPKPLENINIKPRAKLIKSDF